MTAPLSPAQRSAIDDAWRKGLGLFRAASAIGVSETTIARRYRLLKAMGIPRGADDHLDVDIDLAPIDIPLKVIADRDRRATLMPRDLVSWLQGDPLPGYSALEQ